jgi:hypothetical protein
MVYKTRYSTQFHIIFMLKCSRKQDEKQWKNDRATTFSLSFPSTSSPSHVNYAFSEFLVFIFYKQMKKKHRITSVVYLLSKQRISLSAYVMQYVSLETHFRLYNVRILHKHLSFHEGVVKNALN